MAGWEWFGQIERRIEEWWRFAQFQLANDALARNDFDRAVNLARSIILRDEFDEPAWELAIHALAEKGDRAAAQRELRRYRGITLRELNAEPPAHLYHSSSSQRRRTSEGCALWETKAFILDRNRGRDRFAPHNVCRRPIIKDSSVDLIFSTSRAGAMLLRQKTGR